MSMTTKLDRLKTCLERVPPKMSHEPLITWSCEIMRQIKNISTTTIPMANNINRVITYNDELPPIKPRDPDII